MSSGANQDSGLAKGTHFNYAVAPNDMIGSLNTFDDDLKGKDAQALHAYRIQMQQNFD